MFDVHQAHPFEALIAHLSYPRSKARATTMRCTSEGPSPIRLILKSRYQRSAPPRE